MSVGSSYHPYISNGVWCLITSERPFLDIVYMCRIPDDEAVMLKLKYGG